MKVIDLLNKIANGEEVPKKIRVSSFETGILCKEEDSIDYEVFWKDCDGDEHSYWLFNQPTYNDKLNQTIEILNDKAEIIEEDKKIEKIPITYADNRKKEEVYEYLRCTINEIIDYLEKEK